MTRFLNWLGYRILMWGPTHLVIDADTKFGRWCLERAGAHVYSRPPSR